jgi:GGDEF domain-containing protein
MRVKLFLSHIILALCAILIMSLSGYIFLGHQLESQFYVKYATFFLAPLVVLSIIASVIISKELSEPVIELQKYAQKLSVGEMPEKHESLSDADVAPVVAALERFYKQTHKEKSLDQNPLSGLPGNKSLYDALYRRIESNLPFAVGYINGNNFAAYNNKYGFEKGDSVIRFMGTVTMNAIKEKGNKDDNIYHLGADRYFFISTPDKVRDISEKIIKDYDTQIVYYYDEEDRDRGLIISKDNQGNAGEFAFMPICIGISTNTRRPLLHPLQIGHIMGEIRKFLKDRQKSDFLVDRRKTDRKEEYEGEMAPFTREELEEVKREIEELERKEEEMQRASQPVRELTTMQDEDSRTTNSGASKPTEDI